MGIDIKAIEISFLQIDRRHVTPPPPHGTQAGVLSEAEHESKLELVLSHEKGSLGSLISDYNTLSTLDCGRFSYTLLYTCI